MKKVILFSIIACTQINASNVSAQETSSKKSFTYNDPAKNASLKEPETNILNSFIKIRFAYLPIIQTYCSDNIIQANETLSGQFVNQNTLGQSGSTISKEDCELFQNGVNAFTQWKFEEAQKIFAQFIIGHPEDDVARFYLGLAQLYRGYYSASVKNLSLLNKRVSLASKGTNSEFLDDIKLYFAICALKLSYGKQISKTLFKQLNYDGCKYQAVSKGMIDLL